MLAVSPSQVQPNHPMLAGVVEDRASAIRPPPMELMEGEYPSLLAPPPHLRSMSRAVTAPHLGPTLATSGGTQQWSEMPPQCHQSDHLAYRTLVHMDMGARPHVTSMIATVINMHGLVGGKAYLDVARATTCPQQTSTTALPLTAFMLTSLSYADKLLHTVHYVTKPSRNISKLKSAKLLLLRSVHFAWSKLDKLPK